MGFVVNAQTLTQTIRGTVLDRDSRVTLPGATVLLLDMDSIVAASTDLDGNFRLEKVPVGYHNIQVSFVGYEDVVVPNVLIQAGRESVLTIELSESVKQLDGVVIKARDRKEQPINELSVVSTKAFSVEETKRYSGSFDDPSRMALSFAGVSGGNNDEQNEIIIRGNSPRGLMWQIEGVEVPTPNHFADNGSSDGAVSMLSSQMLANSDFSTGAFTSQYGNAVSGVFDIKLRKGNNQKREYAFQLSLLGVDVAMEGPFKKGKKASYLFNYRYSTLSILDKMGLQVLDGGVPAFQDLSFKVDLPTQNAGKFSVFGIGGLSDVKESEQGALNDSTKGDLWTMDSGSDMGVMGINHNYIVGPKFYIHSSLSFATQYIYNYRNELDENDEMKPFRHEDLWDHNTKALIVFNNKINARHQLKTGLIYTLENYRLEGEYLDTSINEMVVQLDEKGHTHVMQAYINWRYRISEKLTFIAGVHGMYYALNQKYSIEPRASVDWVLPAKQRLSFGFGMHSKREGLSTYLGKQRLADGTFVQNNKDLDLTRSIHVVLGYSNQLLPELNLKVELYYQHHYNVPIDADPNGTFSMINLSDRFEVFPLVNKGKGRNYGMELTLEKFFAKNYFILFTGSLFQAFYTGPDGVERHSRYDNNYIFNIVGGKEFLIGKKKNDQLGLSGRFILAGGRRYTPIDLAASEEAGYAVFEKDEIYTKQTPVYYRIDMSIYYRWNGKRANMLFKVDVQNVMNRANVVDYVYSPRQNRVLVDYTGELVPVLVYKVQF